MSCKVSDAGGGAATEKDCDIYQEVQQKYWEIFAYDDGDSLRPEAIPEGCELEVIQRVPCCPIGLPKPVLDEEN